MSIRALALLLALFPAAVLAQSPTLARAPATPNVTTLGVLLANRPARFSEEQWLRMMEKPLNRSLYPLRVTQEMLDTLDARKLDLRYHYEMVPTR